MNLLIPTYALPPLSYRVPKRLSTSVRVGSVVVVPLSGRPRLGVVVAREEENDRAREEVLSVAREISLPADLVEVCAWVSEAAALPLPTVLRAALPPGMDSGRYRVLDPAAGWPWEAGDLVGRAALVRVLGREGLRSAEQSGSVELAPALPRPKEVEWALMGTEPDLGRAPRQRELFAALKAHGGRCRTRELLSQTGASRAALRALVARGAVRLVLRPEPAPVFATRGGSASAEGKASFASGARRVVDRGGAYLWRTPTREQPGVVAAVARAALAAGEQTLVLAPDRETVERLVRYLRDVLPAGHTVAPYHAGLDRGRAAVYRATRDGKADVVVGTRAAALLPLARPGAICVVDEPDEAHRAEPGYEGLPLHVRGVALERARIEGTGVLFLSPFPSLKLYASQARRRGRIRELPPRPAPSWPHVRIVDMRNSGATLSPTLLDACRREAEGRGRVGVVANRLGYATALTCNRCGAVSSCPTCRVPLALHEAAGLVVCGRCGLSHTATGTCTVCGSDRLSATGLAIERVREEISSFIEGPVGLLTAGRRESEDAPVVVGTARCILEAEWDAVAIPDADAFLLAGGAGATERAFRMLYGAAEAARELLVVQTRLPEHYALRTAARGDYPAFAAAELPRLRALGYPPYAFVASLTFEGTEAAVRRAVESRLRPVLDPRVEISTLVPLAREGGPPAWRVLLRSKERSSVARAGTLAARLAVQTGGLKVGVDVDPEEV